jgi:LacI family transcriptional regulator
MDMKPSRRIARTAFGRNAGCPAAHRLRDQKPRPRALFVASAEQAFACCERLPSWASGVPDDLAIVGFDGLREAGFTVPGLTRMRQVFEEAAVLAVKVLLDGTAVAADHAVRLPVALQPRGSRGCADDFGGSDAGD